MRNSGRQVRRNHEKHEEHESTANKPFFYFVPFVLFVVPQCFCGSIYVATYNCRFLAEPAPSREHSRFLAALGMTDMGEGLGRTMGCHVEPLAQLGAGSARHLLFGSI